MTGRMRGAWPAAAALAGAGLLLAACGSSAQPAAGPTTVHATGAPSSPASPSSPPATSAPASPSSPPATGAAACLAPVLSASVGASGAAAGTTYTPIDLANESGRACLMDGFPTVWFATSEHGRRVGPAAVPDVSQGGGRRVMVRAGGSAHFWLEVPTAANWSASSCHPVTAHWLRVVPPGQTAPLRVHLPYGVAVCSRPGHGPAATRFNLFVMPVQSGRGIVGQAP